MHKPYPTHSSSFNKAKKRNNHKTMMKNEEID